MVVREGRVLRAIVTYLQRAQPSPFNHTLERVADEADCTPQYAERMVKKEKDLFHVSQAERAHPGVKRGTILVYQSGQSVPETAERVPSSSKDLGPYGARFLDPAVLAAVQTERRGNLQAAERIYRTALKRKGSDDRSGWICTRLASLSYHRGENKEALKLLTRAERRIRDPSSVLFADILLGRGVVHNDVDDLSRSEKELGRAQSIYESKSDDLGLALVYHNRGHWYGKKGGRGEQYRYFERAVSIFRRVGDERWLALELWTIGTQKAQEQELDEALPLIEESIILAKRSRDYLMGARAALIRGDILQMKGAYGESRRAYEAALKLAMRIKSRREIAKITFSRAVLGFKEGEREDAWKQLSRLLALAERPTLIPNQKWLQVAGVVYNLPIFRGLPDDYVPRRDRRIQRN